MSLVAGTSPLMLLTRKAVVLYGPPGTGKTKLASDFTDYFVGPKGQYEVVVFHGSYSYEDFVEGLRPRASPGGGVEYPVVDGPLKRMAARAKTRSDSRFLIFIDSGRWLVVDELNRANVARVFGELILMLEYRNYEVLLPYSGERFQLPENLYLLATMNSADRSIALVDFALRRRFAFVEFPPRPEVLARFFQAHPPKVSPAIVLSLLNRLNEKIRSEKSFGKDYEVGHALFMEEDLDEEKLSAIWKFRIMPLLQEYWYDQPEQLGRFGLEEMMNAS